MQTARIGHGLPPPTLEQALERLEAELAAGAASCAAVETCLAADSTARNRFMVLHRAGCALLRCGELEAAEAFAVRSLRALPRYGAALRLLGEIAEARGDAAEASLCHRYQLSARLRERWFADSPLRRVSIDDASAGVAVSRAWPAERHLVRHPWHDEAEPVRELAARSIASQPGWLARVADGTLWYDSFNTVVWNRAGHAIDELCRGFAEIVHGALDGREPLRVEGSVCLLGNRNARNYYHWMNDALPRLGVLEDAGVPIGEVDRFLVDAPVHPFHRESLERLGIEADRLLTIDTVEHVRADEILVPVYGSNSLGLHQGRRTGEFLRARFGKRASGAATRRLWVSRGTEGARGVVNEAEVLGALLPRGFENVRCETLSLAEQAALFAEAEVVLGPHGAGLSNAVFCRPGTQLIELFDAHIEPCFWITSELHALRHAVLRCGVERHDGTAYDATHDQRRDAPLVVSVETLCRLLDEAGIGPR